MPLFQTGAYQVEPSAVDTIRRPARALDAV
jgi:hypothetical protein